MKEWREEGREGWRKEKMEIWYNLGMERRDQLRKKNGDMKRVVERRNKLNGNKDNARKREREREEGKGKLE